MTPTMSSVIYSTEELEDIISYRQPMYVTQARRYTRETYYPVCPRCSSSLDREYVNYCDRCGQMLNWRYFAV